MLATRHVRPWQVLAWVKLTELILQARPKALRRTWLHQDLGLREAMQWYTRIGRRVWPFEVKNFFLRDAHVDDGPTLERMWGAPQEHEELPLTVEKRRARLAATG